MKVSPIVTQLVKGFMSENSQLARAPRSSVMTISANALTCGVGLCVNLCADAGVCAVAVAGAGVGASAGAGAAAGAGAGAGAGA